MPRSQRRACFHRRFGRWKMRTRLRFAVAAAIAMLTTGYARSASNQDAIPVPPPNPFRIVAPAPSPPNTAAPAPSPARAAAPAPSPFKTAAQDAIPVPAPNPFRTAAPAPNPSEPPLRRRIHPRPRRRRRIHPRPRRRRRAHPKPKPRRLTTTTPPPGSGRRPTIKAVPEPGFCSLRRMGSTKGGSSRCSKSLENKS